MCLQNCKNQLLASSVCPSTWNNSAPTERILMKFDIWASFWKSVSKIQVCLKSDYSNGYFMWKRFHIYGNITLNSSWDEECFKWKFGEHVSLLQYMYVASLVYYYLFTVEYFNTYAFSVLWCLIIISYDCSVMCVRVMWFQVVVKLVLVKWKLMPVVLLVDMSLSTMGWKINGHEMGAIGWVAYNLPAVAP